MVAVNRGAFTEQPVMLIQHLMCLKRRDTQLSRQRHILHSVLRTEAANLVALMNMRVGFLGRGLWRFIEPYRKSYVGTTGRI